LDGIENPQLPWCITVHFSDYPKDILTRRESVQSVQDVWLNNLKEVVSLTVADETCTLRHGSAKKIFTLPTNQITSLYQSFISLDGVGFNTVFAPLTTGPRHIPLRVFLPPPHPPVTPLIAPKISSAEDQTLGTALHQALPALFPSRRTCLFARPVCQGIIIPMNTSLMELGDVFSGGDGWMDIVVVMMS
jgi:autophagy-related protein 5